MANESKRIEPAKPGAGALQPVRGRPQPVPAVESPAKGAAKGQRKEKKPVSAASMFIICFLLFVLFAVAAFAVLNFNLFDMRNRAILLLAAGSSPYEQERAELVAVQLALEEERTRQELKETELIGLQTDLDRQRQTQEAEQVTLDERRAEIDQLFEAFTTRTADFEQLVAIYESMTPTNAAAALSLIENIDDIARIMSALKRETAAGIIDSMDTALAASITQRMLP